jgi:hypothetical protein
MSDLLTEKKGIEAYRGTTTERFNWYRLNRFLLELGKASENLKLSEANIIHIGGTALFYRAYQTFGPLAMVHFRGTHDMDIVSFSQGTINNVLDLLKSQPNSLVKEYTANFSTSLPNKRTFQIKLSKSPGKNDKNELDLTKFSGIAFLGLLEEIKLDVYEPDKNQAIKLNNRLLTTDKLIFDPPEKLSLPNRYGCVSVPSLVDYFILKMDIVDYSESGLRPKDKLDILVLVSICKRSGIEFGTLLEKMIKAGASKQEGVLSRLENLENLFGKPLDKLVAELGIPTDYPFLPKSSEIIPIKSALSKLISKTKRAKSKSIIV